MELAQMSGHTHCVHYLREVLEESRENVSLPSIENEAVWQAKLEASHEKVEEMKSKTKSLLQTKHEEMKGIIRTLKQQQAEKLQQMRDDQERETKELVQLHKLQVDKLRTQLDEHRLLLSDLEEQASLCTCQAPRESPRSTKISLDRLTFDSKAALSSLTTPTIVTSGEISPRSETPLVAMPPSIHHNVSQTPPARRKEVIRSSRALNTGFSFDESEEIGHVMPLRTLKASSQTGLSRSLQNFSTNLLASESPTPPRVPREGISRVDTPSPLLASVSNHSLLRIQTDENKLRSPSLTDLHQQSLEKSDTMHGQRRLLQMDGRSPGAIRKSPTRRSPKHQHTPLPNSGRSPGSLPHLDVPQ